MAIKSAIFAAAALLATANAHIIMKSPVPYSNDKIDNSPLSGAAQFPCKAQNGFTVTKMNAMKVGEKQQISFTGSAVHGGGSCQLSYTQDTTPTANSKFKVIKSIEGGCPGVEGPKDFDFTLPESIPNGKGTFAWTWFSKMAGQPELYMNCAPIEVTGGASDASKLSALPDMLVANMASINTCKQVENKAIKFPSAGKEVQATGSDAVPPTGSCGASSGGSDSSSPSSGASQPSSAAGTSPSSAAGTKPSSAAPTPTSAASKPSQTGGGVFAPSASSAPGAKPTAAEPTTLATSVVAPSVPAGTASPPTATGAPSPGGSSSTCTQNGQIVCKGTTQFGLCNNGSVVFQAVAAGTQCSNGAITKRGYNGRIARPRRSI
ncbi:hypothetical protein CC80DRAFT_490669 [Byssothecium circinans]|uniref:Lytic polysaccharide monooxygenase n=1 Tax=Byssothecium circinans TaxID=147558 RepID=A0A6A5U235_9PLEO|nr:hypothetical protein CC80DRAFT_490669 [Byssothecium circinans]